MCENWNGQGGYRHLQHPFSPFFIVFLNFPAKNFVTQQPFYIFAAVSGEKSRPADALAYYFALTEAA